MDYLVIEIDDKEAGVWQGPRADVNYDALVKWEDVIDDYGEPEALGANAWMGPERGTRSDHHQNQVRRPTPGPLSTTG